MVDGQALHHAEAFRQGYEQYGTLRWGWHCLTCGAEEYVPTMQAAEEAADAHDQHGQS